MLFCLQLFFKMVMCQTRKRIENSTNRESGGSNRDPVGPVKPVRWLLETIFIDG